MYVMCLLLKFKKLFPLHMVKKSYPGRTSIFFTWWVMKCIIAFYTCNILFPSPMVLFTCSDFSASWIHFLCSVVATCQFFGFIPDAMVTFSGLLIFCFRYVFYLAVSKLGSWINSWYNLNLSLPPGIQGGGMGREGSCILLCVETGFLITISSKGILQYILLTWHLFLSEVAVAVWASLPLPCVLFWCQDPAVFVPVPLWCSLCPGAVIPSFWCSYLRIAFSIIFWGGGHF